MLAIFQVVAGKMTPQQVATLLRILPSVIITIDFLIALSFLWAALAFGNGIYARKAVYWAAAAILTSTVTY